MIPAPTPATIAAWLRRAVVVIAAAYLLILPQFTTKASFFGVHGLPGPLAVVTLGLGLWLMPILLAASWAAEGRVRLPHPLVAVAAGLFVVGAAVSTAVASDKAAALVRASEVAGLWAAMAALAQAVRGEGERRFLLAVLVAAGAVSAALAVEQAAVGLPKSYAYFQAHREEVLAERGIEPGGYVETMFRERFFGGVQAAMGHPNVLASFLLLAFFAAAGLVREKWTEIGTVGARVLAAVPLTAAVLCAVGIILTQSRAAMGALAVGAYWLIVALRIRRRRTRIVLYLLPMLLAAGAVAAAVQVDHPALTTLRYRLDYWSATLDVLRAHGLTGVGLENFGHQYLQYKRPWAPEAVSDPHNLILSVWSTVGVAGLAALVVLAAAAVRAWWRRAALARREDVISSEAPLGRVEKSCCSDDSANGEISCEPSEYRTPLGLAARGLGRNDMLVRAPASVPGRGGSPHVPRPSGPTGLPGLLIPTMALAALPVSLTFLMGWEWGLPALTVMAILAGLLPAESGARLEASGRPMRGLAAACIVGVVALALAEQIGTAILAPPAAWAVLVLLVVTLGPGRADGAPPGLALPVPGRFLLIVLAMAFCFAYGRWVIVPEARQRRLLREAMAAGAFPAAADEPARYAAQANPLAWEPDFLRASFWHREAAGGRGPEAALAVEHALAAYRASLARFPRNRRAYRALADCYLALPGAAEDRHSLTAAEVSLRQAAALDPTDIPTRLRLAEVLERLGRDEAALAAYRAVLRLDELMPMPDRRLAPEVRREVEARVADLAGT